ncbi:hypothetical protein ACFPVS_02640 [Neisseria weixii]|uniref:hypothetical protein n=1 Tax=Neisseria weixii TaxID=1853276 RepID=UPI000BB7D2F1|nr:hypothetical protein [Neisseria weixii]ATD64971.1 hypothetical protein CGZ65_05870 [Neisseria weixii]
MLKPSICLKVYVDSTEYGIAWKQADLEVEIAGGSVRFYCGVELDGCGNILPATLRISDLGLSEFLHDGTEPKESVLLNHGQPSESDNIYPVSSMRPEVFGHALATAASAVVEQLYETEYV